MTRLLEFAAETVRGLITRRVRLKSDTIPYLCEDVPRRKILNAVLTEASVLCQAALSLGLAHPSGDRTFGALQPEMLPVPS